MPFRRASSFAAASLLASALCLMIWTGTARAVTSAAPWGTTTQLTILANGTQTSQINQGTAIKLTAQVTGPANTLTRGQVRFCKAATTHCIGTQFLGLAQITPAGTATLALIPGSGVRSYRAEFLGIGTQYAPSKSPNESVTVSAVYPTTTTLSTTGGPGTYSLAATVTGTGSSMPLAGTVSLADIAGTPGNAAFGQATLGASISTLSMLQGPAWPAAAPVDGNHLQTADFNNDGIPDVVTQTTSGGALSILLGKGDGSFTPVATIPLTLLSGSFLIADCNGDGIPDIVFPDASALHTALGNGDGTFGPTLTSSLPATTSPLGINPFSRIAIGDFNRDGIVDVAAVEGNYSTETFSVVISLGNGDGTFQAGPSSPFGAPPAGARTQQLIAGDFNNDGLLDLVALTSDLGTQYGQTPPTLWVMFGDGTGHFALPVTTTNSSLSLNILTGDFNGDGIPDLAGVGGDYSTTDNVGILLGVGDGTFTPSVAGPVINSASNTSSVVQTIVLADLNQDGIDDVVVKLDPIQVAGNNPPNNPDRTSTVTALLGTGQGKFQQASFRVATEELGGAFQNSVGSRGLLSADWNGDGSPDLLVGMQTTSLPLTLLGTFTQTAQASLTTTLPANAGTHVVEAVTTPSAPYAPSASATVSLSGTQPFTAGVYQIISKLNASACLDVANAALTNNAPLIAFNCHGATSRDQLWRFNPVQVPEGTGVQVISVNSGSCMDDPGGSYDSGTPLIQYACGSPAQSNQTWRMVPSGDSFQFVSLRSGKCLSLPNDTSTDDTQTYQVDCGTDPGQLWSLNVISGTEGNATQSLAAGPYRIMPSADSSTCVYLSGGRSDNGTPVITAGCATPAGPSTRWQLLPAVTSGGSGYQIVSASSAKCLDVGGSLQSAGAAVVEWVCGTPAQANQVWQFFAYGTAYEIVSVNSGKCLQVPAEVFAILKQDTCAQGKNPNLLWQLSLNVGEGVPTQNLAAGPYLIQNMEKIPINGYPTTACLQVSNFFSPAQLELGQCGVTGSPILNLVQVQNGFGLGYEIQSTSNPTLCLDMPKSPGGGSTLTPCARGHTPSQVFSLYPRSGSFGALSYEIVSNSSGLCLYGQSHGPVYQGMCSQGQLIDQLWALVLPRN